MYTEISAGTEVFKDEESGQWRISDDNTNEPEPTNIFLVSIASVCDDNAYWSDISDLHNNSLIDEFLNNRCKNLRRALNTYAEYLVLQKQEGTVHARDKNFIMHDYDIKSKFSDDLRIPLVWPDGTYGLPRVDDHCPLGEGFDFVYGYRRHDTEDSGKNDWSNKLHLSGYFKKNNLKHEFCMKTNPVANLPYSNPRWPKGHYCLYKKDSCPEGFIKGSVCWDDEDDDNDNKAGGSLPDGDYGRNTRIYYCCREDGSYRDEIYLPTDKSFYLIRKGGECQKVHGMTVTEEYVYWDDENHKNDDELTGSHPDDGNENGRNHKLYFCYYCKNT